MGYAVRFEDVYKEYPFYQHITAGFKSFVFNLPGSIASLKKTRFIALKGVSFDVKKGETFGIIGRNGSGKSTTLGLIAGVIRQDRGHIKTDGRISSLLELGAGFHPDLSGIENIILNGILMGNTREEMLRKVDEIIEFSELGDFIYQPLRTYSSGMYVRLGFSVAVHIDPEILLVDEALAVGDLNFQEKCLGKMTDFKKSGVTIIMASHDLTLITRLCDRVAWIDGGSIMANGKPEEVILKYLDSLGQKANILSLAGQHAETQEQTVSAEPASAQDGEAPLQASGSFSWWDSPLIIKECETVITGNPGGHFYEFLRGQCMIESLEKGLSISNRLKGMIKNLITYGICKSFDVIDGEDKIAALQAGTLDIKEGFYDLFLSIDALNRIKNLNSFLEKIDYALADKGVIISLEYIGPANFQWSDKETEIADMIYKSLNDKASGLSAGNTAGAVSSVDVIPAIERIFDISTVRYFGSPLDDLVFNKILDRFDENDGKDSALLKTIIRFEHILVKQGVLENSYALIIARKRSSG